MFCRAAVGDHSTTSEIVALNTGNRSVTLRKSTFDSRKSRQQ